MDSVRLAEMMRATLSEDKTERDAAEEQLKQVKQHTMCFPKKCENHGHSLNECRKMCVDFVCLEWIYRIEL